jgi:hypothetical protein
MPSPLGYEQTKGLPRGRPSSRQSPGASNRGRGAKLFHQFAHFGEMKLYFFITAWPSVPTT